MSCAYMHVGGGHNLPFLFSLPILTSLFSHYEWEVNLWLHMSNNNMCIYANMNNLISFRLCRFSRKKCCRGRFSENVCRMHDFCVDQCFRVFKLFLGTLNDGHGCSVGVEILGIKPCEGESTSVRMWVRLPSEAGLSIIIFSVAEKIRHTALKWQFSQILTYLNQHIEV